MRCPMRVLMVSTSYPADDRDWHGRFIADMALSLSRRADVNIKLWAPPGDLSPGIESATESNESQWLRRLQDRGGIAHILRGAPMTSGPAIWGLLRRLRKAYRRHAHWADVVHVNWLQNALPLWGTRQPALVTVLGSDYGLLRLPSMVSLLRAALRGRRCILAPNAPWMSARLVEAFGDLAEVRPIPFGVDADWFTVTRHKPADSVVHWLVVTRLTRAKLGNLFNWGRSQFDGRRMLHLFGPMQEQIELPPWVHYHGPTNPTELRKRWFPRAAGLMSLSRHDEGRPQVMLEAMAAGLPVIASDLPAHRDCVRHGANGWIVRDQVELGLALSQLEVPSTNQQVGQAARDWARTDIGNWEDCAARYACAYERLLGGPN